MAGSATRCENWSFPARFRNVLRFVGSLRRDARVFERPGGDQRDQ
jgi:hypothetical protein